MNTVPGQPPLRITSSASLLAVIPHLLGFTPDRSFVVVSTAPVTGRVDLVMRYDLPDPPDHEMAAVIADHATAVLAAHHYTRAVVAGYGPGPLVTPLADALRAAAAGTGLELGEVVRAHEGRYWSYLCTEPSCCPADGVLFDPATDPAAARLAAAGRAALPDRAALAATIAPVTGPPADAMAAATARAERAATRLLARGGEQALAAPGLAAVQHAIGTYRDGGSVTAPGVHAWLALALLSVRIRDDAWARMDPAHRDAHRRLWTDVTRRARHGYIAAPATLLAFTAWQSGDGALANLALDRALADSPGYSMAHLIRDVINAGAPPSAARLRMTPEEVADSYADLEGGQPGGPPLEG